MSIPKYAYTPEFCNGVPCPGNCDHCGMRDMQAYTLALNAGLCPRCKKPLSEVRESDNHEKRRYCFSCFANYPVQEDST